MDFTNLAKLFVGETVCIGGAFQCAAISQGARVDTKTRPQQRNDACRLCRRFKQNV